MDEQNTVTPTPTSTTSSSSDRKAQARSAKELESARRKFSNLTNGRVTRALRALRVVANIGKLAVSRNQLSEGDVEKIMLALEAGLADTRKRLNSGVTGQQLDVEFDVG